MATTTAEPSRRRRHAKACGRCRKRKIRCDLQYPTCAACAAAGATCLGFDAIHGTEKPRSAVRHLEEQVARLEMELAALGKQQSTDVAARVAAAAQRLTTNLATATAMAESTSHPQRQESPLLPLTSKYFLADSPLPPLNMTSWDDDLVAAEPQSPSSPVMMNSSIPRHVIDAMLKHYCATYRPQYPSIGEQDLYCARDKIYQNPQLGGFDAFVLDITLAISFNTLMHIDEKRTATTASGLWAAAVAHLSEVGLTSSWERLQALQLLTHYGFLNPKDVHVGHCAAAASRLAFQLGLHRELPPRSQMELDATALNTRRRMFWNAYAIDAAAHSVRGLPLRWTRPEITAKFPDSEPPAIKTHSTHIWSLREIECNITMGLEYPGLKPDLPYLDTSSEYWYLRMETLLGQWHQSVRQSITLADKIEFHETLFQIQVLRLNRPSPRFPRPDPGMQKKAIQAATALIKEFSVFAQLDRMFMIWHAAHCVIEAATYLLSTVLAATESRAVDRSHVDGMDVTVLVRYIKTLPSLVSKLTRRWPSIAPHASILRLVSQSTLEALQHWSEGQESWHTELSIMKEQLGQLTRLWQTRPHEQASSSGLAANTFLDMTPGTTAATHLTAPVGPTFEHPDLHISTPEELVTLTARLPAGQEAWDQSLANVQESVGVNYSDLTMWDFDGLDPEAIFAALLEGEGSEAPMLEP